MWTVTIRTSVAILLISVASLSPTNGATTAQGLPARVNATLENATSWIAPAESRILGGSFAPQGTFPYQAGLWMTGKPRPVCGASIADAYNLVTAANCVTYVTGELMDPRSMSVTVGNVDYRRATKVQVSAVFIHREYNRDTTENDIAVLRTKEKLPLGRTVQPIAFSKTTPAPQTPCNVSGWGATAYEGNSTQLLKYVKLNVMPPAYCRQMMGTKAGMLCAEGLQNEAFCQGDIGGPLVCNGLLAGVVSHGKKCGELGYPGVYTDVSKYADFLQQSMTRAVAASATSLGYQTLTVVGSIVAAWAANSLL